MRRWIALPFLPLAFLMVPLANGQGHGELQSLAVETRKVADAYAAEIREQLVKALETSGPLRGVAVCKYGVPEISSAFSRQTGWKVSRVTLKPRNPFFATADAWERGVLQEFDARTRRGEAPQKLERFEIVREGAAQYFRYMRAIPITGVCAGCHGMPGDVPAAVKALLESEYPKDQALGYSLGEIRGAVTVKRPL